MPTGRTIMDASAVPFGGITMEATLINVSLGVFIGGHDTEYVLSNADESNTMCPITD